MIAVLSTDPREPELAEQGGEQKYLLMVWYGKPQGSKKRGETCSPGIPAAPVHLPAPSLWLEEFPSCSTCPAKGSQTSWNRFSAGARCLLWLLVRTEHFHAVLRNARFSVNFVLVSFAALSCQLSCVQLRTLRAIRVWWQFKKSLLNFLCVLSVKVRWQTPGRKQNRCCENTN